MSDFFEQVLEKCGGKDAFSKNSNIGRMLKRHGVVRSGEFLSVSALPRRRWQDAPDLDELVRLLSAELQHTDTDPLWAVQAAAIRDAHDLGGAFLPVGVGKGKTLASLLTPGVLQAKRPLLLIPAKLRKKTYRAIETLGRAWKIHPGIRVHSYTELSLEKNAGLLEEISPDLIVMDEGHHLRNPNSGRTRRVHRYLKEHPETGVIAMSGSFTKESIRDYAHILRWCLKERTPLPESWGTLCDWADAIDARVPDDKRVEPGALLEWCAEGETVRQGYQRRLNETPGVVNSPGVDNVDASLTIALWDFEPPRAIEAAFEKLEEKWETPNGDMITEAIDVARHSKDLAQGFWLRWDPPGPRDWMDARQAWKAYVRHTLGHNRRELDTELQVWNEVERWALLGPKGSKQKEAVDIWLDWKIVAPTFEPNSVPTWITNEVVAAAAKWAQENTGIVWVSRPAMGKAVAKAAGCRYYGAGDDGILDERESCVASIRAHGEGNDLQHFSESLVLAPPASGDVWEQLLGRMHRSGQEADEVKYTVYLPSERLREMFETVRQDAVYIEQTFGTRQKINFADVLI